MGKGFVLSKICYVVCIGMLQPSVDVRVTVQNIVSKYGYHAFFEHEYQEPLLDEYDSPFVISIADAPKHDNCEMLLLPDGYYYNGRTNTNSFVERMAVLRDVVIFLRSVGQSVELFLGTSGTAYDEFVEFHTSAEDIAQMLEKYYCPPGQWMESDVHIIITS